MAYEIRILVPADSEALDHFLKEKTAEAYFLRSNAKKAGLTYNGEAFQAEYIGAFKDKRLVGVIAYTWINSLLIYAEDRKSLPALCSALRSLIAKRQGKIEAVLGLTLQVAIVLTSLGIPATAYNARHNDGLFQLDLMKLKLPTLLDRPNYKVRHAEKDDFELIVDWRVAFNVEALGAKLGDSLRDRARSEISRRLEARELYLLEQHNIPVSLCGAGGFIEEMIIVGPVWTPPELRNRGYGKAVTAGALKILKNDHPLLKQATLFAVRPDAIRLYENLGFIRTADWGLVPIKEEYKYQGSVLA